MSNSKLTKSFNFTLGCIVPFSGVTPTKKAPEKIKKNEKHTKGRRRRGMEIDGERESESEGETNNNNNKDNN